jgi:hypothetical protein
MTQLAQFAQILIVIAVVLAAGVVLTGVFYVALGLVAGWRITRDTEREERWRDG